MSVFSLTLLCYPQIFKTPENNKNHNSVSAIYFAFFPEERGKNTTTSPPPPPKKKKTDQHLDKYLSIIITNGMHRRVTQRSYWIQKTKVGRRYSLNYLQKGFQIFTFLFVRVLVLLSGL